MGELKNELQHFRLKSIRLEEALKFKNMEAEDFLSTLMRNEDFIKNFNDLVKELRWNIDDKEETWFTTHSGSTTKIWANFGGKDPNTELAEIWPCITEQKDPPADAKEWDGVADKLQYLER